MTGWIGWANGWEGGGEQHDVIAHISSHSESKCSGSVSPHQHGALESQRIACVRARVCVPSAHNHPERQCGRLTACQLLFNTSGLTHSLTDFLLKVGETRGGGEARGKKMEGAGGGGMEGWKEKDGGGRETDGEGGTERRMGKAEVVLRV